MKVSIVIPAYNEEKYVTKCIESLLKQTYQDFELIFVDDGSTDNTKEIIKEFIKKDKRIKLLTQKHGGPGRGRNLGVKNSKGEIIVLIDADMEFYKDYVKNLIQPILKGKEIGTYHIKEYVANKYNIWAKCWGTKRVDDKPGMKLPIFRAILKKEFLKAGGFDPSTGLFDDNSLSKKLGKEAIGVDAVCYHNNPTNLPETFNHAKWIGGSFIVNENAIKIHVKRALTKICLGIILLIILITGFFTLFKQTVLLLATIILLGLIFKIIKEKDIRMIYGFPAHIFAFWFGFLIGALKQTPNMLIKKIKKEEVSYRY